MLELEFINSIDHTILGEYLTYKDRVSIGTSRNNDIVIDDSELEQVHLIVVVSQKGLLCSVKDLPSIHYYSNGKKIMGQKYHNPEDLILIGQTSFKIKKFEFLEFDSESLLLENYKKIENQRPDVATILSEIKFEYLRSLDS